MRAIKDAIKSAAFAVCPDIALKVVSIRSRRLIEAQVRALQLDELARRVSRITNRAVAKGPFSGMTLDYEALPIHGTPKFLGTYEQELHQCIERAIELSPRSILNVGCAEGYYAVGFARRLPAATVWAADADPKAQRAALINASLNGVGDRVAAVGAVRSEHLGAYLIPEPSLLFMDCEGAEFTLLDPVRDPILLRTHIIVEVHAEFGSNGDIVSRFESTHRITQIDPAPRHRSDATIDCSEIDILQALDERTDKKSWLFMEAKET
jgi:hypothetical protein